MKISTIWTIISSRIRASLSGMHVDHQWPYSNQILQVNDEVDRGPWVPFVTTGVFSVRITKNTSRIGVSWTHSLPFWFWALFNPLKWAYNQKDINQINLNYIIFWNLARPMYEIFVWISLNLKLKGYLRYRSIFRHKVALDMQLMNFIWRKKMFCSQNI